MIARVGFLCLIAVSLGACSTPKLPLASMEEVTYLPGAKTPDSTVHGSEIIEVRTLAKKPENGDHSTSEIEVAGANCLVKSDHYTATLVTPAGLRVPLYGYQTPELSIECSKSGYNKTIAAWAPYNKTMMDRLNMAQGGGLLGVLVIAAYNAASDETNDEFQYHDPRVLLTRSDKPDETKDPAPAQPNAAAAKPEGQSVKGEGLGF
ncbi:hypothetical protein [Rhodospirillum sp. A1_3_36]|uniref:hypothetical protein n=1 Tax=Rhodospirillum sp. A1_3_36 TaxID=3391666 RepID=UPI0039A40A12